MLPEKPHPNSDNVIIAQKREKVYRKLVSLFYGNRRKVVAGFGWICYNIMHTMDCYAGCAYQEVTNDEIVCGCQRLLIKKEAAE